MPDHTHWLSGFSERRFGLGCLGRVGELGLLRPDFGGFPGTLTMRETGGLASCGKRAFPPRKGKVHKIQAVPAARTSGLSQFSPHSVGTPLEAKHAGVFDCVRVGGGRGAFRRSGGSQKWWGPKVGWVVGTKRGGGMPLLFLRGSGATKTACHVRRFAGNSNVDIFLPIS